MDEIWVPCKYNKEVFEKCGIIKPIKIVPHPFVNENLKEINEDALKLLLTKSKWFNNSSTTFKYGDDWKIFYTIGEWNDRKNLKGTVETFCKAFSSKDHVKLIIKTFHSDYTIQNENYCVLKLKEILEEFKDHPGILLISENLNCQDILLLHSIGDCFFSMTRGEGFCLDAFDAYNYKKNIIIPGFGGHVDYLGEEYKGLIKYNLTTVDFPERESIYSNDQKWAEPDIQDGIDKLTEYYKSNTTKKNKLIECSIGIQPKTFINKTDQNLNITTITINPEIKSSGIMYIGQFGTSGYATAAKGNMFYFFEKGVPVTWKPLYFDNSTMNNDCMYNIIVKSFLNKQINAFDTVILHSTPDLWPEFCNSQKRLFRGKKIVGYTVWETSKLPMSWVEYINDSVEEVWCPSNYNKHSFEKSGINIPIKVFPHVFLRKTLPRKSNVKLHNGELISDNNYFTFYNISELNPRKGVEDLVKVFCETFTADDKVRLIIKVHCKDYSEEHKNYCLAKMTLIISKYKKPPKIYLLLNNLTETEILGLHSIGDCYISLCKSEGFGLTIFEAFKYGKKVIVTGYGGQLDYLGNDYEGLVKFKIGEVEGMKKWNSMYEGEWAYPNLDHAGKLMKDCL
jgi:glycosyltransferase involved in cell wall biosynthesis